MKNITLNDLEVEKEKCRDAILLAVATFQTNTGIMDPYIQLNGSTTLVKGVKIYSCSPLIQVTL